MKNLTAILISVLLTLNVFGQSLFFDSLDKSAWISDNYMNDTLVSAANEIRLTKLNYSMDSINFDQTIWIFKEKLTVNYYKASSKEEKLIGIYDYKGDKENGSLLIKFKGDNFTEYKIGMVSTGNFVTLTKREKRKRK